MSAPPPPSPSPEESTPKDRATLIEVAGAVFWSFFGVRKGRHMAADMSSIRPLHVILVGLALGAAFVVTLIVLVRFIIAGAA